MMPPFLRRRPWLLVWAAFLLLVAVWVTAYMVSRRVATGLLTPGQEEAVLRGRHAR